MEMKKEEIVKAAPAFNGDVAYPVLAEAAGLGVMGNHGFINKSEVWAKSAYCSTLC